MATYTYTLTDPRTGHLALRVLRLENCSPRGEVQRLNYYSLILVTEGKGSLLVDVSEQEFSPNALLCFAPYQPFILRADGCAGFVINFHPDFFCIHKHHEEVACNGVLFNNIYQSPVHEMGAPVVERLLRIIADMREELEQEGLAQYELLVSYLKIFLIMASRSRVEVLREEGEAHREDHRSGWRPSEGEAGRPGQEVPGVEAHGEDRRKGQEDPGGETHQEAASAGVNSEGPFVLRKLKDAIEEHYRLKHSAAQYADLLNITPKALAKITKMHFNRTLTDMISDRIIIEAKRELYLTSKPVKSIAYELGFDDEYHFSRYFKNKAEVSLQLYRTQVGSGRGE